MPSIIGIVRGTAPGQAIRNCRPPVRLTVVVTLIAIGMMATLLVTLGVTAEARRRLERQVGLDLLRHAVLLAATLDRALYDRRDAVRVAATLDARRLIHGTDDERHAALDRLKAGHAGFVWVGFADASGLMRAATGERPAGLNVADRAWFKAGLRDLHVGDLQVGDLHEAVRLRGEPGDPARPIDLAAPVRAADGGIAGVLAVHLDGSWVRTVEGSVRTLLALRPEMEAGADILVLGRDGTVILGPPGLEGTVLPAAERAPAPAEGWSLLAAADGTAVLSSAAVMPGQGESPGLGWTVVVRRDAARALLPIADLRMELLGWGLFFTALLALMALAVGSLFTTPLALLLAAAAELGRGNPVRWRSSFFRETHRIGEALAAASIGLRERERRLTESEAFARGVIESSTDCIKVLDLDGRLEFINALGRCRLDLDDFDQVAGRLWSELWPEDLRPEIAHLVAEAAAGRTGRLVGWCPTLAGIPKWWDVSVSPVCGPDGRPQRLLAVSREITGLKETEERLRLVMGELNHRVKNILATVQAVVSLSARSAGDVDGYRDSLLGRIGALGKVNDLLARTNWDGAVLRDLLRAELDIYDVQEQSRICLDGPHLVLPASVAASFAMVVHELTTNSAKYGSLSVQQGWVAVAWSVTGGDGCERLHLDWTEGGGPVVAPPTRTGFGTRMIEKALGREQGADIRVTYPPEGLRFHLSMPLPGFAPAGAAGMPADAARAREPEVP